jgi:hypothetical protein
MASCTIWMALNARKPPKAGDAVAKHDAREVAGTPLLENIPRYGSREREQAGLLAFRQPRCSGHDRLALSIEALLRGRCHQFPIAELSCIHTERKERSRNLRFLQRCGAFDLGSRQHRRDSWSRPAELRVFFEGMAPGSWRHFRRLEGQDASGSLRARVGGRSMPARALLQACRRC